MSDLECEQLLSKICVEKIINDYFKTNVVLNSYRGTIISKGIGFLSYVIRVHLEWDQPNQKHSPNQTLLPRTIIAKFPTANCVNDALKHAATQGEQNDFQRFLFEAMVKAVHITECHAYKTLWTEQQPPIPIPIIYAMEEKGENCFIAMEDIDEKGALIMDRLAKGLSFNQWKSIVIHLADLHAWSLMTEIPWKQFILDTESASRDVFKQFMPPRLDHSLTLVKQKYPDYFGHIDEELWKKHMTVENFLCNREFRHILPDVLVQGDSWVNNIMFEKDPIDPKKITDKVAAFLDWQLAFSGCGIFDLARLNSWSVPHEMRRSQGKEIVKIYFDRLTSKASAKLKNVCFDKVWETYCCIAAVHGLWAITVTNFLLQCVVKDCDDKSTNWKQLELLNRMKAGYEDSAAYFTNKK